MLYIAKINNPEFDITVRNTDEVYYGQPHTHRAQHLVPAEVLAILPADSNMFADPYPSYLSQGDKGTVLTGLYDNGCQNMLAYTSCKGNMAMVLKGHDDNCYLVLNGNRHGLMNPLNKISECLGYRDLFSLDLTQILYITRTPEAHPLQVGVDEWATIHDEPVVSIDEDEWAYRYNAEDLASELRYILDEDDLISLIKSSTAETAVKKLQELILMSGYEMTSREVIAKVDYDILNIFHNSKYWEGRQVMQINGIPVLVVGYRFNGITEFFEIKSSTGARSRYEISVVCSTGYTELKKLDSL